MQEIYRRDLENWQGSDDEESDSESEDEESDISDEEDGGVPLDAPTSSIETKAQPIAEVSVGTDLEASEAATANTRPQPRPFETLRDFFTRTSTTWQDIVLGKICQSGPMEQSVKELRKVAFEMSESKWWDSREEITALEDEHDGAGMGEVINIADRNNETGSAGRRR